MHKDCNHCPLRSLCSKAKIEPRELLLQKREEYETLYTMRQRQVIEDFKKEYAIHEGIEATHGECRQTTSHYINVGMALAC